MGDETLMEALKFGQPCMHIGTGQKFTYVGPLLNNPGYCCVISGGRPSEVPLDSILVLDASEATHGSSVGQNGFAHSSRADFAPDDPPEAEEETEEVLYEPTPLLDLVRGLPPGSTVSLEITLPGENA